jgi:hypothetical protein
MDSCARVSDTAPLVACGHTKRPRSRRPHGNTRSFVDRRGETYPLPESPQRIRQGLTHILVMNSIGLCCFMQLFGSNAARDKSQRIGSVTHHTWISQIFVDPFCIDGTPRFPRGALSYALSAVRSRAACSRASYPHNRRLKLRKALRLRQFPNHPAQCIYPL